MSPVIVLAVINGVQLYRGSPCPWESKKDEERGGEEGREGEAKMDWQSGI